MFNLIPNPTGSRNRSPPLLHLSIHVGYLHRQQHLGLDQPNHPPRWWQPTAISDGVVRSLGVSLQQSHPDLLQGSSVLDPHKLNLHPSLTNSIKRCDKFWLLLGHQISGRNRADLPRLLPHLQRPTQYPMLHLRRFLLPQR